MGQDKLRDQILKSNPGRAAKYTTSSKSAVRLFCIECMGGVVGDARKCKETDCLLWPHGLAALAKRNREKPVQNAVPGFASRFKSKKAPEVQ